MIVLFMFHAYSTVLYKQSVRIVSNMTEGILVSIMVHNVRMSYIAYKLREIVNTEVTSLQQFRN